MSEYMEKHTISRLIGAPPGYVGFDQGGLLTDSIRKHPYCVLLLDEIEKAHSDIFNLLLQIMDYATLTDNYGKKSDFRNVILIMTSNAGSKDIDKKVIGFGERTKESLSNSKDAVKNLFNPEFRNRLNAVITFNPLSMEIITKVVDKFLNEIQHLLIQKKIRVSISETAKAWLTSKGYDQIYGARPLYRLIQTEIKDVLSENILLSKLRKGMKVNIDFKKDRLIFQYSVP
jgi:ATP-dependent Clp protease ATP-binding subunit ClpA